MMNKCISLVILLGVFLLGCVAQAEEGAGVSGLAGTVQVTREVVEEEATGVSVVRPSPTFDSELVDGPSSSPSIPSYVRCSYLKARIEEKSYWVDDFIPGENTIDDLLQDDNVEISETPKREGGWVYYDDNDFYFRLFFLDGVLWEKWDPRMRLGEIISHYGHPTEVTWSLVKRTNSSKASVERVDRTTLFFPKSSAVDTESVNVTYLFFPQSNAIFSAEGKISGFDIGIEFFGSIYTPDFYEEIYDIINNQPDRYRQIIQFPWPCG